LRSRLAIFARRTLLADFAFLTFFAIVSLSSLFARRPDRSDRSRLAVFAILQLGEAIFQCLFKPHDAQFTLCIAPIKFCQRVGQFQITLAFALPGNERHFLDQCINQRGAD
jgi:hypothetical protein